MGISIGSLRGMDGTSGSFSLLKIFLRSPSTDLRFLKVMRLAITTLARCATEEYVLELGLRTLDLVSPFKKSYESFVQESNTCAMINRRRSLRE